MREVQYGMEILLIEERLHLESAFNDRSKTASYITRQQIAVVSPSFCSSCGNYGYRSVEYIVLLLNFNKK